MQKNPGSYVARILAVDLSTAKIEVQTVETDWINNYIGGVGLAARILWDETTAATDPFSEENPLLFMVGPLSSIVPMSSRYTVVSISPLTGIWGEAHSGGSWGYQLKRAGYDGIIFRGKADHPVYLWVNDEGAGLADAKHLWGIDAYDIRAQLRKETDSLTSVAAIGTAGEQMVRLASIITDGPEGRTAARCGMGAVMGAKKLKAVVVRGKTKPRVHAEEKLLASIEKYFPRVAPEVVRKGRQDYFLNVSRAVGVEVAFKNYQHVEMGSLNQFIDKLSKKFFQGVEDRPYYCRTCTTSGFECHMDGSKRGSVAYAKSGLGSLCMVDDMEAVERGYEICNRLGIDVISTAGVIAFAMEAFDKGIITMADTDQIDLSWGNPEGMLQMVSKIGKGEGFGSVLGLGSKAAAEEIGANASDFAMHVKGLEIPQRSPWNSNSRALEYATSNRGACQLSGSTFLLSRVVSPDLDIYEMEKGEKRFEVKGKGELVAKMQNMACLLNSMTVCVHLFSTAFTRQSVQPSHFVEWLNYTTGLDINLPEFLKAGERIFNLERLFNIRRGITSMEDTLPPRIRKQLKGGDKTVENSPLTEMLAEYYSFRGWDKDGKPKSGKLADLGLEDFKVSDK